MPESENAAATPGEPIDQKQDWHGWAVCPQEGLVLYIGPLPNYEGIHMVLLEMSADGQPACHGQPMCKFNSEEDAAIAREAIDRLAFRKGKKCRAPLPSLH